MREKLRRYWNGEVPLSRVFYFDMLTVGTIVNVFTGGAALAAFAMNAPAWLAATIFFSPLPYNLTLLIFVLRAAARDTASWSHYAQAGAIVWFATMLVV